MFDILQALGMSKRQAQKLANNPCSNWPLLKCDGNGMVISISLSQKQLSGEIPKKLSQLHLLRVLDLAQNQLSGEIPKELSQIRSLQELYLAQNQLSGKIPKELSQLQSLKLLHLTQNQLSGEIPKELSQLQSLQELHLARNQLQGDLKEIVFNTTNLKSLDLSFNLLSGESVMSLPLTELEELDLSHNQLVGGIWKLIEPLCGTSPAGMSLEQLRLNHNKLSGELPPCLLQFKNLQLLALNNNYFWGAIPEVRAPELVVLALHKNAFTGHLPTGLDTLEHLGVLTVHENMLVGVIPQLSMTTPCIDNGRYRVSGVSCSLLRSETTCNDPMVQAFGADVFQQVIKNCPRWCGACPNGTANMTLHRNRLSGNIPSSISRTAVLGLCIMGNMLGNGRELNSSWILPAEKQPFLYYSPKVWNSHTQLLGGMYILFFGMVVFSWPLGQKFLQTYRSLCIG
ncbi:Probable leucine-rich repeat receptor-like protein kinase At5g63930, partial [Durusdinium trenchii]